MMGLEIHKIRIIEIRNPYKIIIGKPEEEKQHGSCSHTLEDNIKVEILE
jgi:hypothetical protein